MEKALRDRLLKFEDELNLSGGDIGPEDLKEATLFTLKALGAHLKEKKGYATYEIDTIDQAIVIVELNFAE
ncbi:hypothetical protein ES706_06602 [subsurface metagenome]